MPETRWIDAQIRWNDVVVEPQSCNTGVEYDDFVGLDPFADPHPQETFVFAEQPTTTSDEDPPPTVVEIRLDGFKADADQVWQSTGLTLWSAARELSRYLLQHPDLVRSRATLEVRMEPCRFSHSWSPV
jgi:hypothetical protein